MISLGCLRLFEAHLVYYCNNFVCKACNCVNLNRLIHDMNPEFIKWSTVRDNVQFLAKALPNLPEVSFGPYPAPMLTRA
jgi:hypothetical protein